MFSSVFYAGNSGNTPRSLISVASVKFAAWWWAANSYSYAHTANSLACLCAARPPERAHSLHRPHRQHSELERPGFQRPPIAYFRASCVHCAVQERQEERSLFTIHPAAQNAQRRVDPRPPASWVKTGRRSRAPLPAARSLVYFRTFRVHYHMQKREQRKDCVRL